MSTWKSTIFLVATAAIACAPPAPRGERRDSNLITREELLTAPSSNAFDAIMNLRPSLLRSRGGKTADGNFPQRPQVFLDGQQYGDIETLKTISVQSITSIRLLNAADATTKYGYGYPSGVIEVSTRSQ